MGTYFSFLLSIQYGVIDVNQIHIQKPRGDIVGYYFFFQIQSLQHEMKWTILVDYYMNIQEVFIGMLDSMNDACILCIKRL
jgi:hypothetical protein